MSDTLPAVRDVNNGASYPRPQISKVAKRFAVRRGIASQKTAAHKLDDWFRVAVDVIESHRDCAALDVLNVKLARFYAVLRETAENCEIAQLLRAKVAADAGEEVPRSDYQAHPCPETQTRLLAALRLEHARTGELIAALEVNR